MSSRSWIDHALKLDRHLDWKLRWVCATTRVTTRSTGDAASCAGVGDPDIANSNAATKHLPTTVSRLVPRSGPAGRAAPAGGARRTCRARDLTYRLSTPDYIIEGYNPIEPTDFFAQAVGS